MSDELTFLATCARGTGAAVRRELAALGAGRIERIGAAVHFSGGWELALRACIHLRAAHRVLWEIARFPAPDARGLYEGAAAIDWRAHLSPRETLAVEAHGGNDRLTDRRFIALKVKDAVVDRLRAAFGARPDVDPHDPTVQIVVHVQANEARLSLDLSGESMHRRGYRVLTAEAPLRETLAAAILELGEFDGARPMIDPMCGSGTLPIEAALIALRRPPGLERKLGCERWPSFSGDQARLLADLRAAARAGVLARPPQPILAGDVDPRAVEAARANARQAGVEDFIRFSQADLRELELNEPQALLAVNPPYGLRGSGRPTSIPELYRALGGQVRRLRGGRALVLMADRRLIQAIGMAPTWCRNLMNGPVPVVLACFDP